MEIYVRTDVEADGPIPGPNSMLGDADAGSLTRADHRSALLRSARAR